MTVGKDQDMAREIAALESLDRPALLERWESAFGREPPPRLSRPLLEKALAHDLQVRAHGGLSRRTVRALKAAIKPRGPGTRTPGTGTRLIREWNGVLHEVEVLENGYLWQGKRHRSLSAIARVITGTKWSGPRFFGIRVE
jgi:hypothetical protein